MSGRTTWFAKDAAWWRRNRIVRLGRKFGPAGPAVVDWLTCEAKSQGPARGHDGTVKTGYDAVAYGCFIQSEEDVKAIVEMCVQIELLDDFDESGEMFTARVSGWHADVEMPLEASRRALQRAGGTNGDNGGHNDDPGGLSQDVPECGPTVEVQDSKETPMGSEGDRLALAREQKRSVALNELFDVWRDRCRHPTAKFTPDRRRKVEARLRDGYTPDDIRRAIDGAARKPYVSDDGKRYDDLALICRNGEKLEAFMDRAGGPQARRPLGSHEMVKAYDRDKARRGAA